MATQVMQSDEAMESMHLEAMLRSGLIRLAVLRDPRIERCKKHSLGDLLTVALCAVLSGRADYVFTLKANHGRLHRYAAQRFASADERGYTTRCGKFFRHDSHRSVDGGHGRIETRNVTAMEVGPHFHPQHPGWDSVQSLVRVQSLREQGATTTEPCRYFLTSLPATNADVIASAIRAHWSIENDSHWTLDVQMNEDLCRIYKDHGPHNFATLRRFALGRLRTGPSLKLGNQNQTAPSRH